MIRMLRMPTTVTVGLCLMVFWFTCCGPASAASAVATPVFVIRAQMAVIDDRIEALGTLHANESVELTASVTDTVSVVNFDDGDRVEAGRVLVEMTSDEEHAQLEEARIGVAEARRQYERIRSLVKQQSASESLLDERKREWETGRARLAAIESRLADRLVRAPFAGVVGLRNVSIGALVQPGDLIATLDDDSVMKLDFSVPAVLLGSLAAGLPVVATTPAWQGQRFEGVVKSIDSRIDPVTRTVIVRALLSNAEHRLRPGMLMQVELSSRRREAIVIPEESLVSLGVRQFVYVVSGSGADTVERREVSIGVRRPGEVEITAGLNVNELVVTDGALKLRPGATVTIRAMDDGTRPLHDLLEDPPVDAHTP